MTVDYTQGSVIDDEHQRIPLARQLEQSLLDIGVPPDIANAERIAQASGETLEEMARSVLGHDVSEPYRSAMIARALDPTYISFAHCRLPVTEVGDIGRGGFGNLTCGWYWPANFPVAIKTFDGKVQRDDQRKSFEREVSILQKIDRGKRRNRSSIAPAILFSNSNESELGFPVLVSQYCDGINERQLLLGQDTTHEAMTSKSGSGEAVADEMVRPLSRGYVAYSLAHDAMLMCRLHEQQIVHLDLKPDNILIDVRRGVRKLCDFGISRSLSDADVDALWKTAGTPNYCAPEQFNERWPPSMASDVYGLCTIAFERITGRLPYSGESDLGVLCNKSQPIAAQLLKLLRQHAPKGIAEQIERGLQYDPGLRPTSWQLRDTFILWHLAENRHLLPADKADGVKTVDDFLGLSPEDTAIPVYCDDDDPLIALRREDPADIGVSPAAVRTAYDDIFPEQVRHPEFSLPPDARNTDKTVIKPRPAELDGDPTVLTPKEALSAA